MVNRALDLGVNFIHTSFTYGDSAYKIGKVMKERRDDCFLAVKMQTKNKTKSETEELLKRSLEALNTDHIDIAEFNYVANKAKEKLLSVAAKLDLGVIAMKTLGRGGLPEVEKALRYVWGHDIDTAIVGMNKIEQVEQLVSIATNPLQLDEEEQRHLQRIAEEIIKEGRLSKSGAVCGEPNS